MRLPFPHAAPHAVLAICICILTPGMSTILVAKAAAAQVLSGSVLQQRIPGARINLDTPLGSVVPISYGADGSLQGKAGAVAFFLGASQDRGKWWVEGSRLCHQWRTWFNGRRKCFQILLQGSNRVKWTDQDGDSGTGTIVALGGAPNKPQQTRQIVVAQAPIPVPQRSMQTVAAAPLQLLAQPARQAGSNRPAARPADRQLERVPRPAARPAWPAVAKVAGPKPALVQPPRSSLSRPAPLPAFKVVNVARDDVLNIRRSPSSASEIVTTLRPQAAGILISGRCVGEWCPVRHGRAAGWVNHYFLAPETGNRHFARNSKSRSGLTYRVVRVAETDVLNIRRLADGESQIVAGIPATGNRVRITGYCLNDWCPVTHAGKAGWVNRQYLALEF